MATMMLSRPKPMLAFVGIALLISSLFLFSSSGAQERFIPQSFRQPSQGHDHGHEQNHNAEADKIKQQFPSGPIEPAPPTHNEARSASRRDGLYWPIIMPGIDIINPNIIPHPNKTDVWIVVAQRMDPPSVVFGGQWSVEVSCEAKFTANAFECIDKPEILPVASSSSSNCTGDTAILNANVGPHDARVFYGPKFPYIVYGSNSGFTCFGQFMQDFRALVAWPVMAWAWSASRDWIVGTELQRPKFGNIEKNWFVFWDHKGEMYLHHDIYPERSYVKIEEGTRGKIGGDLAPLAAENDAKCMKAYMPVPGESENFHQATNSLAITMCMRGDVTCDKEKNTLIMHLYHLKLWHEFHGVYEPYIMLFDNKAPFGIHAITKKPFWIRGRAGPGKGPPPKHYGEELRKKFNQTEMVYVTSWNWKDVGLNYHGYLDDILMLGFGIEDSRSATMDVRAGDLLHDLGICADAILNEHHANGQGIGDEREKEWELD